VQQFVGSLGVELRVGAQEGQELREAALEFDLLDDAVHFLLDARYFLQSDLVDLLRGEVQGGVLVDLLPVVRLAVGHGFGSQGGTGLRNVLVDEERAQPGEGRHHAGADGLAGLGLQPCLLGGGDAGR